MTRIKSLQSVPIILALAAADMVHAKMYKWVDENGVTQYTQTPPPGDIKAETIKPKLGPAPTVPEKDDPAANTGNAGAKDSQEAEAEQDPDAISDAEYEAQVQRACESARKSYQSFQRNRVNIQDEDGNYRVAGEEERQAGLKKAEEAIKKYCK